MSRHLLFLGVSLLAAALWAQPAASPSAQETQETQQSPESTAQEADRDAAKQFQRPGQTGLPLPRFVSLRAKEVNLRTGPGARYPIDWVYRRRHLPVEIIDEFDTWRRVRDWQGTVGWVHQSMLQGRRTVQILGHRRLLQETPDAAAAGVAQLEPGVIGELLTCRPDWCQVQVQDLTGWLRRDAFFGAYPQEPPE